MSDQLIGLTIVAIGTSLPELLTSIMAALKRNSDLAFGNIIGSNILNILFIAGSSALIKPLAVSNSTLSNLYILIGINILLFIFVMSNKENKLLKSHGAMFLVLYFTYLYMQVHLH